MAVADDIDALYAGDPDEFVAGRQALAKRLKAAGDRDAAADVATLRRPTAAAWAVNQLARRHADGVAALVALGDDLRRTHERLLAGGRDDTTVVAGRRRREAVADLVDRAASILTDSGRSADAHRDAIAATLNAASLDPDAAAEVVAGRLSKELEAPSGFGEADWPAAAPSVVPAVAAVAARPAPAKAAPAAEPSEADERRARKAEEARQRAASARTAATRARSLADQAREAADRAEAERERLEEEVIRARKTAVDSRRAARELRDAAHEAERQASALEDAAGS